MSLQAIYSQVRFVKQSDTHFKQDFKPLTLSIAFDNSNAEYVMFGVDDNIFKEEVDFKECIKFLNNHKAYCFLLRLGKNITYSFMTKRNNAVPPFQQVSSDIISFDYSTAQGEWNYPNNVDMTIYKKSNIRAVMQSLLITNPWDLEGRWSAKRSSNHQALCFNNSKILNLDINLVNPKGNWKQFNAEEKKIAMDYSLEQLLHKFEDGFRIDISQFYKFNNNAPHVVVVPTFIQ